MPDLTAWFAAGRREVDEALDRHLAARAAAVMPPARASGPGVSGDAEDVVQEAMRYSLLGGGKRLRPLLALLTGEALGAGRDLCLPYACALEMVHTYSLIHDDLPAMDNDDLRRGRPTCHKVYGEATAILAGDALLTRAFEILGEAYVELPAPRLARTLQAFAGALGARGMVGGQSRDLAAEGKAIGLEELQRIHAGKTGALIRVSLEGVALLAGAPEPAVRRLAEYGDLLGLAFQIKDDLLDIEATAEQLGKTPGKDVAAQKATYPRIVGIDATRTLLRETVDRAAALAADLPGDRDRFVQLAHWVADRGA